MLVHATGNEIFKYVVTANQLHGLNFVATTARVVDMAINRKIMAYPGQIPIDPVAHEKDISRICKLFEEEHRIVTNDIIINHEFMTLKNVRVDDTGITLKIVAAAPYSGLRYRIIFI